MKNFTGSILLILALIGCHNATQPSTEVTATHRFNATGTYRGSISTNKQWVDLDSAVLTLQQGSDSLLTGTFTSRNVSESKDPFIPSGAVYGSVVRDSALSLYVVPFGAKRDSIESHGYYRIGLQKGGGTVLTGGAYQQPSSPSRYANFE